MRRRRLGSLAGMGGRHISTDCTARGGTGKREARIKGVAAKKGEREQIGIGFPPPFLLYLPPFDPSCPSSKSFSPFFSSSLSVENSTEVASREGGSGRGRRESRSSPSSSLSNLLKSGLSSSFSFSFHSRRHLRREKKGGENGIPLS